VCIFLFYRISSRAAGFLDREGSQREAAYQEKEQWNGCFTVLADPISGRMTIQKKGRTGGEKKDEGALSWVHFSSSPMPTLNVT